MESGIYKTKNKGGGGCSGFIFVIGGRGQVGGGYTLIIYLQQQKL